MRCAAFGAVTADGRPFDRRIDAHECRRSSSSHRRIFQLARRAVRGAAAMEAGEKMLRQGHRTDKRYEPAQANMRRIYELHTFGRSKEPVTLGDEREENWDAQSGRRPLNRITPPRKHHDRSRLYRCHRWLFCVVHRVHLRMREALKHGKPARWNRRDWIDGLFVRVADSPRKILNTRQSPALQGRGS